MVEMKVEIKKLIKSIIYILMGLQMVLGAAWIFCNLGEIPRFEESRELLAMSERLQADEYTGILYPLCIRGAMMLGTLTGLSGCAFLYLLQLSAAWLAYGYFGKKVVLGRREWSSRLSVRAGFFAGFVLTLPTVVQSHLAVLPYSLASSVFLVVLADTVQLWHRESILSVRLLLRMGGLWIVSALLCPAYGWFSAVAVGISLIRYTLLHKEKAVRLLAVFLAAVLCSNGLNAAFQAEGSTGKIQRSLGAVMVARLVWPNFSSFQYFWGPEVKAIWDYDALVRLSTYPERVIYEFGPILEEAYGKEAANEIYWEMAGQVLSLDTKNIVLRLLKDTAAYFCPPLTMLVQLQGVGVSYTGWNYGRMKDFSPQLTKYYVEYALKAWVCMLVLVAVSNVLFVKRPKAGKKSKVARKKEWIGGYLGSVFLFVDLWYVMTNGHMQDYKRLIVSSVLCGFLVVRLLEGGADIAGKERNG